MLRAAESGSLVSRGSTRFTRSHVADLEAYHAAVLTNRAALARYTAGKPRIDATPDARGAPIAPPAETALVDRP